MLRFLVLAPLGWLIPSLRRWLHQHASSLVMDLSYVAAVAQPQDAANLSAAGGRLFSGLPRYGDSASSAAGFRSGFLIQAYATAIGILYLNHIRTLGAHRYINAGGEMTFVDQLLDSVNYPNSRFFGEMAMPVGLRFHALHHLFPTLPYHNLAEAHERLMAQLPAESPYRATVSPGLWTALGELWDRSRRVARGQLPAAHSIRRPVNEHLSPANCADRFNEECQA